LGLARPPLAERIAASGWEPDEPRVYCRRCVLIVGPHEAVVTGCSRCRGKRFPWGRIVRLGPYEGLLRECVQEVKFTRWRRLGHELGVLLGRSLASTIEAEGAGECVVVPVPCSFRRRLARGIDHSLVLARGVAAGSGLPIVRALARSHRPTQLSVPAGQRAANVAGSIRVRGAPDLAGRTVVLIDDVTTTRATLLACAKALGSWRKPSGGKEIGQPPRIWAAVVAVTRHPDERPGEKGA
jgi:predicted amidophosphoribosyltransferase